MTTEQLSGLELSKEIARRVGWTEITAPHPHRCDHGTTTWWADHWHKPDGTAESTPVFAWSVDALSAGPEAKLREAGLWLEVQEVDEDGIVFCVTWAGSISGASWIEEIATAPVESTARARACYQALTAIAAIEEGEAK